MVLIMNKIFEIGDEIKRRQYHILLLSGGEKKSLTHTFIDLLKHIGVLAVLGIFSQQYRDIPGQDILQHHL